MGVIHYQAWNFDPRVIHAELAARLSRGRTLALDDLRQVAFSVASTPSAKSTDYLAALAVDRGDAEGWRQVFEPDSEYYDSATACWYSIAMAEYLDPAPPLNNAWLLEYGLNELGWSSEDQMTAIGGYSLASLADSSGIPLLVGLAPALRRTRGWLAADARGSLLNDFEQLDDWFSEPPSDVLATWAVRLFRDEQEVRAAIKRVHTEAKRVLRCGLDMGLSLRIVIS